MRAFVLGPAAAIAAAVLAAAPAAAAGSWPASSFTAGPAFAGSPGGGAMHSGGGSGGHDGWDRPNRRGGNRTSVVLGGFDRDFQGDSAWRANSFNDWWHERPNRAFPRWMQNNQKCERQWWGGGVWRC